MQYQTTRASDQLYTFAEIVRESVPQDGGLFVPRELPKFSREMLESLQNLSFIERAKEIFSVFASDLSPEQIDQICKEAFSQEKFADQMLYDSKTLNSYVDNPVFIFMDRGPSAAYTDFTQAFSLACLKSLTKAEEKWYLVAGDSLQSIKSLVATSFEREELEPLLFVNSRLCNNFDMKEIQHLWSQPQQIKSYNLEKDFEIRKSNEIENSIRDGPLTIFNLRGKTVEIEKFVQNLFYKRNLREELAKNDIYLAAMSNINFTHHIALIIILVSAYLDLLKHGVLEEDEEFALAFPNIYLDFLYVGKLLKELGLPISHLFSASNTNRSTVDFLNKGEYRLKRKFLRTNTPNLDQIHYPNLERLIYEIVDRDKEASQAVIDKIEKNEKVVLTKNLIKNFNKIAHVGYSNNKKTSTQISNWYLRTDYLFDPYTALTLDVLERFEKLASKTDKVIIPVVEHPLLSPQVSADAIFDKRPSLRKKYFQMLTAVSEESGLTIPAAAYSGQTNPKIVNLNAEQGLSSLSQKLLDRVFN